MDTLILGHPVHFFYHVHNLKNNASPLTTKIIFIGLPGNLNGVLGFQELALNLVTWNYSEE